MGHGGIEKLHYRDDVPVPTLGTHEVLVKNYAAGVNNTDINTRIGWYSKSVTSDTNSGGAGGFASIKDDDASWSGNKLEFPRIQGADCCGRIVATGDNVDPTRIGERVLVRTIMPAPDDTSRFACWTLGSECDGAFAQFTKIRSSECFAINCNWLDIDLASIPCAYSTAENMLHRANLGDERVVITGASGGVGAAACQTAWCRSHCHR